MLKKNAIFFLSLKEGITKGHCLEFGGLCFHLSVCLFVRLSENRRGAMGEEWKGSVLKLRVKHSYYMILLK